MLNFFNRKRKIKDLSHVMFTHIVEQARTPLFYSEWKVADTLDGRFDLIILHVALVVHRLEQITENAEAGLMIRYLQEVLFDNMDMSLREIGVGDMSVGKKVKVMAEAFYGRKLAYKTALLSDDPQDDMRAAVVKNVYRDVVPEEEGATSLTSYILRQSSYFGELADEDLLAGQISFADVT